MKKTIYNISEIKLSLSWLNSYIQWQYTYHVRQQNLSYGNLFRFIVQQNMFKIGSSIQNKSQILLKKTKQRKPCCFCMSIILQMFTNILKHVIHYQWQNVNKLTETQTEI